MCQKPDCACSRFQRFCKLQRLCRFALSGGQAHFARKTRQNAPVSAGSCRAAKQFIDESAVAGKIEPLALCRPSSFSPADSVTLARPFSEFVMKLFPADRRLGIGFVAAFAWSIATFYGFSMAADSAGSSASIGEQESVKIDPYTGPAIYLPEPDHVKVEPTIVNRETLRKNSAMAASSDRSPTTPIIALPPTVRITNTIPTTKCSSKASSARGTRRASGNITSTTASSTAKQPTKTESSMAIGKCSAPMARCKPNAGLRTVCATASGLPTTTPERSHCARSITSPASKTAFGRRGIPTVSKDSRPASKTANAAGTTIEWTEKGQKVLEAEYTDNKFNGTVTRWFPDGRKIVQQYKNGRSSRNPSSSCSAERPSTCSAAAAVGCVALVVLLTKPD